MNEFAAFAAALDAVNTVVGVRGALLVAARDGVPVASDVMIGVRGDAVAALVASLVQRARLALDGTPLGAPRYVQIEAPQGLLVAAIPPAPQSELVLVAVAEPWVNVGQLRLELGRVAASLP